MSTDLDILVSRVIDGVAGKADWDALEALAAADPGVWRELALAQRLDQQLSAQARQEIAPAQWVQAPADEEPATAVTQRRARWAATWGGWIAAAVAALAFISRPGGTGQGAGVAVQPVMNEAASPFASASDALAAYLERGRQDGVVLGELPDKVLVQTRPADDGRGVVVVYLRQIMECAKVDDVYRPSTDEAGNPTVVPVHVQAPVRGRY